MEHIQLFSTIEYLLRELEQEQDLLDKYNKAWTEHYCGDLLDDQGNNTFSWKERIPHKAVVINNGRTIRRLLLKIIKEDD